MHKEARSSNLEILRLRKTSSNQLSEGFRLRVVSNEIFCFFEFSCENLDKLSQSTPSEINQTTNQSLIARN